MLLRQPALLACAMLLASIGVSPAASPQNSSAGEQKPLPSPPATAEVSLGGKKLTVQYGAPSVRGRSIMGGVVPFGTVWRTGANTSTTFITAANLKIGTLSVPAGTYTLYTLPAASSWMLIVNKQTGQWGTVYNQDQDLGRTPMTANPLAKPQEVMSISFENTRGKSTELHVKWEKTDEFVTVTAQ